MTNLFRSNNNRFLFIELIILFILLPLVLLLPVTVQFKVGGILIGVVYVLVLTVKTKVVSPESLYIFSQRPYWKYVFLRFIILAIVSVVFIYFYMPEKLFIVIKKNFLFWMMLSAFYSVFSVYPQEFLYRSFFFARYKKLIKSPNRFILLNATLFSLAHIGFKNPLVLGITFVGGIVFAITYTKTKSLMFTSIEHALYGAWLFTVGAGEMLAFPMPK